MPPTDSPITIVSGLPRSGTSMLMRMLEAGGLPPLTDRAREPDADNPLGYFELEAVKATRQDSSWLDQAPGKAVKVIHALIRDLPPRFHYRVIFMLRNIDEVLASQQTMLQRSGKSGAALSPEALKRVFTAQLDAARTWAAAQPNFSTLDVHYADVIADPQAQALRIATFVGRPESAPQMAAGVDARLYRNREGRSAPR